MSDTTNLGLPVIDPIISFVTQVLCIAAVIGASNHALRRWTAVQTLSPPELPSSEAKSEAESTDPPKKGLKKVFNKKVLAKLIGPCIFLSVYCFFSFGIRMIKNQTVVNSLWVGGLVFTYTAMFITCTATFSNDQSVSLVPLDSSFSTKSAYRLKTDFKPRHKLWLPLATLASAACAVSFYHGYQLAAPVLAASWLFSSSVSWHAPRITARHLMVCMNGYLIFCLALGAVIGAIASLFDSKDGSGSSEPSEPKKDTTVNPSLWVLEYMSPMLSAFPTWMPGFMLALAMRFDHARSTSQSAITTTITKTAPGGSAVVPRSSAVFARPTFNAGLFALILTMAGLKVLAQIYLPALATIMEAAYVLVSVPVTTLGLVLGAWKQGQLKAWWFYEETWVPKYNKDQVAAKPDAETAPAQESEDEKTSLLQSSD